MTTQSDSPRTISRAIHLLRKLAAKNIQQYAEFMKMLQDIPQDESDSRITKNNIRSSSFLKNEHLSALLPSFGTSGASGTSGTSGPSGPLPAPLVPLVLLVPLAPHLLPPKYCIFTANQYTNS